MTTAPKLAAGVTRDDPRVRVARLRREAETAARLDELERLIVDRWGPSDPLAFFVGDVVALHRDGELRPLIAALEAAVRVRVGEEILTAGSARENS